MKKIYLLLILVLFTACSNEQKKNLDGKLLLKQKCASCHNIDMPPKTYDNEVAPPMMAVSFHVVSFVKTQDESARIIKAVEFVKDYVINPSEAKSFCDKKSLQDYGLMPSQKGKVTQDELEAIAKYMFEHFTQKNLNKEQDRIRKFNSMPLGKRLAIKNNCLTCHRVDKDLVGPSFKHIASRYKDSIKTIQQSIRKGSVNKWKLSHGAMMPAFKKLTDEDLKVLSSWIVSFDN